MKLKNEKELLNFIRFILPSFIIIVSILTTSFLYYEKTKNFQQIHEDIKYKLIFEKKAIIKEQVLSINNFISDEQSETENKLKKELKKRIYEIHKIIKNMYDKYHKTHSKEELRILIKTVLKDLHFGNKSTYFFIYDKTGKNIIHSLQEDLEGKDFSNYEDSKGKKLLKSAKRILSKQDEYYETWYWIKNKDDKKEYKKIGFLKNIDELGWFIGTGEYVDEFREKNQKNIIDQISKLSFGNRSYFFILDENLKYLLAKNKISINKYVSDDKLVENRESLIKQSKEILKNGGGFIYYKQRDNLGSPFKSKISYIVNIPKWNWIIGTGFYLEEIELIMNNQSEILNKDYKNDIINLFIISTFTTIILLLTSLYISVLIKRRFIEYKESISFHIDENKKQYEILAQKSKHAAMGEMIDNIAHQWRQPLSLIRTSATGLKLHHDLNTLDDKMLTSTLDNISEASVYLSDTIDDFRDFFRPNKEKTKFFIASLIYRATKLLSSQLTNRNIKIVKSINDIQIITYERELLQVIINIISNAKDALESQSNEERFIFIDAFEESDIIFIKIKDNAGGIKDEILERIFEPYFTTKHQSRGTGLGLYMSQEIISKHMTGNIEVRNEKYTYKNKKYKGATFTIKLNKNL